MVSREGVQILRVNIVNSFKGTMIRRDDFPVE